MFIGKYQLLNSLQKCKVTLIRRKKTLKYSVSVKLHKSLVRSLPHGKYISLGSHYNIFGLINRLLVEKIAVGSGDASQLRAFCGKMNYSRNIGIGNIERQVVTNKYTGRIYKDSLAYDRLCLVG